MNDHTDDLFRRAAEDYPLNTKGDDWNSVLLRLEEGREKGHENVTRKRNHRRLLWLFLLLPFSFICVKYGPKNQQATPHTSTPVIKTQNPAKIITDPITHHPPAASAVKDDARVTPAATDPGAETSRVNVTHFQAHYYSPGNTATEGKAKAHSTTGLSGKPDEHQSFAEAPFANSLTPPETIKKPAVADTLAGEQNKEGNATTIDAAGNTLKTEPTAPDTTIAAAKPKRNKPQNKSRSFYAGVVAGPDVSHVNFQQVKNSGVSAGLIAGYAISKRFAIEAGVFLDKKYYFSNGKYFDKSSAGLTTNYKIETVNGNCKMIDISLNGRYNFHINSTNTWFATAGLSSYLMKKEDYDYSYKHSGQIVTRHAAYNNSSNNLLSVGNISLGYSRSISRSWRLRIEPYAKIPLQELGIGKMRLVSTGVYAGLIKDIF